ncbi:MAG: TetR/AcrR family transcriptional regulator [Gammaproteobacteria bacterium]|nr:TetR/AcrR family transcriptional regulator [Gammaproteobacteria bacterium]
MSNISTIKRRRGRPPKDQTGFNDTKEALLRSGMELLTEKGYSATGIDEILRQVGVPKGSFYHYFGSKEVFGLELIQYYSSFFRHKLDKFLTDQSLSPIERLIAFSEDAVNGMAHYNFKRGCLVGNLGQEMSALPEPFRAQLKTVFYDWQLKVQKCLEAAKEAGQISDDVDCQQSAYIFWVGWEGAVLRAKLERCPDALIAFSKFYLDSLK